ncbi:hypothetical protein NA56DRAFT_714434 [Hyaloscypha hepaticicola]|uniref:Heterokaryon incompatibility domain-containing protein n=1 Tax=Hyaloscypha hepaticicola TaxID=2082293 RepID=A0A2J6QQH0_9HELO|nr:hypothetical protein NA56DRAFT_714434 [Hyaloscypha hepaticicola]
MCFGAERAWCGTSVINQRDDEEKADQIPIMDKIYSHATKALVWLGEATDDIEQALGQFASLRDRFQAVEGQITCASSHYTEVGLPEIQDPIWKHLSDFMYRSWFQRLWVLQEVILAKHIIFVCGGQVLGFELLRSLSHEIFRTGASGYVELILHRPEDCRGFRTLIEVGTLRDEFSNLSLNPLYLLQSGRQYETREPVDRIYGLLGIMDKDIKQAVIADYSEEARDQYWRLYLLVGKPMIELGYLDLLMFAETYQKHLQLPSWAPDWSNKLRTEELPKHFHAGISPENSHDVEDLLLERFSRTLVADYTQMLSTTTGIFGYCKYPQDALEDYKYLRDCLLEWKKDGSGIILSQYHVEKHVAMYIKYIPSTWANRSFFVTDSGHIGLCSQSCQVGDVVCIFLSLKHTYTIRKGPEEVTFKLIGPAYTDGVMYGEAIEGRDTSKDEIFIIS